MATNPFFDSQFSEEPGNLDSELYADLVEEFIQIKGRDLKYLPRTLNNFDSYFLEDAEPSSFNDALDIEMYLENFEDWQGQQEVFSKFGLELRDNATFQVSARRFAEVITSEFPDITRPREGDILVLNSRYDLRVRAFEITWVDHHSIFYQLGDLPTYKIVARNFEYSGEKFDTGTSIDDYSAKYSMMTEISFFDVVGNFEIGETVTNGTNSWSAEIVSIPGGSPFTIIVSGVKGEINSNLPVIGEISGASATFDKIDSAVLGDSMVNDNQFIQNSDVVDFSETNPFSGF